MNVSYYKKNSKKNPNNLPAEIPTAKIHRKELNNLEIFLKKIVDRYSILILFLLLNNFYYRFYLLKKIISKIG